MTGWNAYDMVISSSAYKVCLILCSKGKIILAKYIGLRTLYISVDKLGEAVEVSLAVCFDNARPYTVDLFG